MASDNIEKLSQIDATGLSEAVARMHALAYPAGCPGSCEACDRRLGTLYWLEVRTEGGLQRLSTRHATFVEARNAIEHQATGMLCSIFRERPGDVVGELVWRQRS